MPVHPDRRRPGVIVDPQETEDPMKEEIDRLLHEAQRSRFIERRTEPRHAFARPVTIYQGDRPGLAVFSKDLSSLGMGVISPIEIPAGTHVTLRIHSVQGAAVYLRCESRWSDAFGKGWWLVGFKFLGTTSPPAQAYRD